MGPDPGAVNAHLERVRASSGFAGAPRRMALLDYLVARVLRGEAAEINEYGIGVDVFDRRTDFDPRLDSIVRTEVSRLRQKLRDYYVAAGSGDPIRISIPPRTYTPVIEFNESPSAQPVEAAPVRPAQRRLLPGVAIGAAAVFLIAVAFSVARSGVISHAAVHAPPGSLVVLPFQNLSPGGQDQYVADGVTEELTNELAQSGRLRVVARTSAYQFKGRNIDIRDIGRQLGVAAALEGSVAREDGRIRITAQLNRTADGYHLWSRAFEAPYDDLMTVEAEAAGGVETAIRQPRAPAQPALRVPTNSTEAHELYLRANFEYSHQTPDSLQKALALFQQAADKDPRYVAAYIGMARSEISMIHLTSLPPKEGFPRVQAILKKALEIDPNSADANGTLATVVYGFDYDWQRAEAAYKVAVANGALPTIRSIYGWSLATRGRFQEAEQQIRLAQDLDPLGSGPRFNQMLAFYLQHRYDDAVTVLNGMLQVNPQLLDAHLFLVLIATIRHDCAQATKEADWSAAKYKMPVTRFGLAMASACRGDAAGARANLEQMQQEKGYFASPYQLALGYALIDDRDRAIEWLRKSIEAREGQVLYLKYEPVFDAMRNDPRYVELEKTVGLE